MKNEVRIARLSGWLYRVSSVLLIILPAIVVVALVQGWADPDSLRATFPELPPATQIGPIKAVVTVALGALTLPLLLILFGQMRGLFARYRQGEILSDACALHILRIGQALVGLALCNVLIPTAQLLALTADNPAGQRLLSVGVQGETLGFIVAGGMVTVIGWAMGEAARIAEENRSFI